MGLAIELDGGRQNLRAGAGSRLGALLERHGLGLV
jgi:hypothetical protein